MLLLVSFSTIRLESHSNRFDYSQSIQAKQLEKISCAKLIFYLYANGCRRLAFKNWDHIDHPTREFYVGAISAAELLI